MAIWALADLHLAFHNSEKSMEAFGEPWIEYTRKIEENWRSVVQPDDLVLVAGDISWSMTPEEALVDLHWIDRLPGTKVMIRGNHDYWWTSLKKISALRPSSIHYIQNNYFTWKEFLIGGTRLWDSLEYSFDVYIQYVENPRVSSVLKKESSIDQEKIFQRELGRLELSLQAMRPKKGHRIIMTHYPPIGADLKSSTTSALLEKYFVETVVFGHLHNVKKGFLPFGEARGVNYHLTSADYLDFKPKLIYE